MVITSSIKGQPLLPYSQSPVPPRTHESSWVSLVGSDLSVDFDESLLDDRSDLSSGEGVLQSVSQEHSQGKRLPKLVRTWGWLGGLQ